MDTATDLAERCITLYGMSKTLGPVAVERTQAQFLEGLSQPRRPISPHLSETIDREIKELIDQAYQMALELLVRNQGVLERIATHLLETETLEGDALRQLLSEIRPSTTLQSWLNPGHQRLQTHNSRGERQYETTY